MRAVIFISRMVNHVHRDFISEAEGQIVCKNSPDGRPMLG